MPLAPDSTSAIRPDQPPVSPTSDAAASNGPPGNLGSELDKGDHTHPNRRRCVPRSRKVQVALVIGLVCLCALVGTMIWYGVDRRRRSDAHPADFGLADELGRIDIPSAILPADGSLATPLAFSAITSSTRAMNLPYDPDRPSNYTTYTSSAALLRLPVTESTFVKIFGESICSLRVMQAANASEPDILVTVDVTWRIPEGEDSSQAEAQGIKERDAASGGWFNGTGGLSSGLVLQTSTDPPRPDRFDLRRVCEPSSACSWDRDVEYTITVVLPLAFSPPGNGRIRDLVLWSEPSTTVVFGNLRNISFSTLDVKVPAGGVFSPNPGSDLSYVGPVADNISLLASTGILGNYAPRFDLTTLTSSSSIPTANSFLPPVHQPTIHFQEPLSYAPVPGRTPSARLLSTGPILATFTGFPPTFGAGAVDLRAASTNGSIAVSLLSGDRSVGGGYKLDYRLATDEPDKQQAFAEVRTPYNQDWKKGRKAEGTVDPSGGTLGSTQYRRQTSKVRLDAKKGPIVLGVGLRAY